MNTLWLILFLIIGLAIGFLIGKTVAWKHLKHARTDAVKRSKSSILGEVYEKIVPCLPNFPFSPKDMVFIGKGFDYLVLNGLSEGKLEEIVFLEVKTGTSTLNGNEKKIKEAINTKKVRFLEWRADKM